MPTEKSTLAERGNEVFERVVRPEVNIDEDARKFVMIDVETEDFEIDGDARAAFDRLLGRTPDAGGERGFAGWEAAPPITSGGAPY